MITESGDDISMLGQFGADFYLDYLVVIKIHVASEHGDDRQYNCSWSQRMCMVACFEGWETP